MIAPQRSSAEMAAELDDLRRRMQRRIEAGTAYGERSSTAMAACAAAMAERFWAGATLLVIGTGAGVTDAQHNAVEYVHPVLPGCRALPALALVPGRDEKGAPAWDPAIETLGRRQDILLVFAHPHDAAARSALRTGHRHGLLTVAVTSGAEAAAMDVDHLLATGEADELVAQELQLATYHVLWELVHIILNHRGSGGAEVRR